ncbi:MAG: diaminopimelate epimerase [candidate division Zixibacteria bacterium]|nr:diaminopimelate epimerase [candidate division Zixibacteria bacterium]
MKILFHKYHALGNSFLVVMRSENRITAQRLPDLAQAICDPSSGVGGDGVAFLTASRKAQAKVDIYNADGSWAEKSGNGLRISALHLALHHDAGRKMVMETSTSLDEVRIGKRVDTGYFVSCDLGVPQFQTSAVPVRSEQEFLINSPLNFGPVELPVTCLAVGNPHTVIVVNDFDFEWQELGAEIETADVFPNGTNVEFVRPVNRSKIRVADWERGAGATGSSGTGAAAAVCALVMMGLVNRQCEVVFETGSLTVNWRDDTNVVELTGPVQFVMDGEYDFRS